MFLSLYRYLVPYLENPREGKSFSSIRRTGKSDDPVLRPSASWARMFFTQPPIRFLTLSSDAKRRRIDWDELLDELEVTRNFTYQTGITINDFICQCEAMLRTGCTGLDLQTSVYFFKQLDRYEQLEGMEKGRR